MAGWDHRGSSARMILVCDREEMDARPNINAVASEGGHAVKGILVPCKHVAFISHSSKSPHGLTSADGCAPAC